MSENENNDDMSLDEERKKLKEMGVNNTWKILTSGEKKKKSPRMKKNLLLEVFNRKSKVFIILNPN